MDNILKKITEKCEELHKLQMIETIINKMHIYIYNIVSRIDDDLDGYDSLKDVVQEIIDNIKVDITILEKYFDNN